MKDDTGMSGSDAELTTTEQEEPLSYKRCVPIGECELCSTDNIEDDPACFATGRRQYMSCIQQIDSQRIKVYQECPFTAADEYRSVVWMQILCLIVGLYSLRLVQRQKRLNASLFDQRRYNNAKSASAKTVVSNNNANNTNNSSHGDVSE